MYQICNCTTAETKFKCLIFQKSACNPHKCFYMCQYKRRKPFFCWFVTKQPISLCIAQPAFTAPRLPADFYEAAAALLLELILLALATLRLLAVVYVLKAQI